MSMLPKTFPPYPERNDVDIYGQVMPAKAVGGDLFDFYIRDEKLFFCIGDVSGKGVPASMFMAVSRSLFRNISAHVAAPNLIVSTLNTALTEGNETNMFVTLFVGVLDLATGRLIYCNAGQDAPLLISQDVSTIACDPNLPIGVISGQDYSMQETVLPPGSTIFLFTDGLNEAEDVDHDQFGDQRINDIATAQLAKGQVTPDTLIDAMTQAVHAFVGEAEQSDDLTMLAIQYHGSDNIKK
jgi:sigma-B regulation protein RsbU (phosphoserine phosphatase)